MKTPKRTGGARKGPAKKGPKRAAKKGPKKSPKKAAPVEAPTSGKGLTPEQELLARGFRPTKRKRMPPHDPTSMASGEAVVVER